jgi:SpoVK/Ycf46/Vps4 family AAA+-type ATPase
VNNPAVLDPAMLRSERIDEPIDFSLPDEDERRDLIERLLTQHSYDLARLVSETEGFNHIDITDLCQRLTKEPIDKVLSTKKRLRDMAKAATGTAVKPATVKTVS